MTGMRDKEPVLEQLAEAPEEWADLPVEEYAILVLGLGEK